MCTTTWRLWTTGQLLHLMLGDSRHGKLSNCNKHPGKYKKESPPACTAHLVSVSECVAPRWAINKAPHMWSSPMTKTCTLRKSLGPNGPRALKLRSECRSRPWRPSKQPKTGIPLDDSEESTQSKQPARWAQHINSPPARKKCTADRRNSWCRCVQHQQCRHTDPSITY